MRAKRFNPRLVSVFTKNGQHLVKTPGGEMIPCVISTIVEDNCNEPAMIVMKMNCNIVSDEGEIKDMSKAYHYNTISEEQEKFHKRIKDMDDKIGELLYEVDTYRGIIQKLKQKWWFKLFGSWKLGI